MARDGTVGRLERWQAGGRRRRRDAAFSRGRPDPGRPEGEHDGGPIAHVVVLMMENHSYDNLLGWMADHGDGLPRDASGRPVPAEANLDAAGRPVPLTHRPTTRQQPNVPTQSWAASHLQWDGGRNDGFVRSVEQTVPGADATVPMQYFDGTDLPFYAGLARAFTLATRWHCSVLGPTLPNRRFLISGTAHGLVDDVSLSLDDEPPAGTVLDLLSAHGISWADYHDAPTWRVVLPTLLGRRAHALLRRVRAGAGALVGAEQLAAGALFLTAFMYPRDILSTWRHALPIGRFFEQAAAGTLPAFSIVDPDFVTYSEENPQDVQPGESFAASVIEAVTTSPCWPRTLLLWLHDEHGGYYDHVPPPAAVAPDDVPATTLVDRHPWLFRLPGLRALGRRLELVDAGPRTFERLGFRVPAVAVSPFARPGAVDGTTFDHTSVLRLVEDLWNLPSLTRRDAAAASAVELVDLSSPPAMLDPPPLPAPATPGAWRATTFSGRRGGMGSR